MHKKICISRKNTAVLLSLFILLAALTIIANRVSTQKQIVGSKAAPQAWIGGTNAAVGEFPAVALLSNGCSGVLIDPKWILTASHCVDVFGRGVPVSAAVGIIDRRDFNKSKIDIDHIGLFGYNMDSGENDIALLRLKKSVKIDHNNLPKLPVLGVNDNLYKNHIIVLDKSEYKRSVSQQKYVVGVGWGCVRMLPTPSISMEPNQFYRDIVPTLKVFSNTLQKLTLPIYREKVSSSWKGHFMYGYPDEKSLTNTSCYGDSGAPLFAENDMQYVIGLNTNSWSGLEQDVALATRVIEFTDQILTHIKNNPPNN